MTIERLVVDALFDLVTRDFAAFRARNRFVEVDHGLGFGFAAVRITSVARIGQAGMPGVPPAQAEIRLATASGATQAHAMKLPCGSPPW